MPTSLPSDAELIEQAICNKIVTLLKTVPENVNVYPDEQFPASDIGDIAISTVPDPVTPDRKRTDIIVVGIPTVSESEYTGDESTVIVLTYPITFDLEVVDKWDLTGFKYPNSSRMAKGRYFASRKVFKLNRDLGYNNCVHEYLQQTSAVIVEDEEEGGRLHSIEWSITGKVTGVLS
jgi:hypothetical protein